MMELTTAQKLRQQEIVRIFGGLKKGETPSIRKAYKQGIAMRAIQEAYDGDKATKEKTARLGRLISMTHLLLSESMLLIDETESMMDRKMKEEKNFKRHIRQINFSFERWREAFEPLIDAEQMKNFSLDFMTLDQNVRAFAKLEGWKEPTEEDKVKTLKERNMNLHREFMENLLELKELRGDAEVEELMQQIKAMEI